MRISNEESLCFELGVMAFQAIQSDDNRRLENLKLIIASLEDISLEKMNIGFMSEAEKDNISDHKTKHLFKHFIEHLEY